MVNWRSTARRVSVDFATPDEIAREVGYFRTANNKRGMSETFAEIYDELTERKDDVYRKFRSIDRLGDMFPESKKFIEGVIKKEKLL